MKNRSTLPAGSLGNHSAASPQTTASCRSCDSAASGTVGAAGRPVGMPGDPMRPTVADPCDRAGEPLCGRGAAVASGVVAQPLFRAPVGTRDIRAPESARRRRLVAVFADLAEPQPASGCWSRPSSRTSGCSSAWARPTMIVTKELFEFFDKGDPPRHLALRPELTASVCRAFAEHRPTPPWKIWYTGPQFRYERPQAGRYRQFDQVGRGDPRHRRPPRRRGSDRAGGQRFYEALGLSRVKPTDEQPRRFREPPRRTRPRWPGTFRCRRGDLSEQARVTLERNPLRVLDSKRAEDQPVIAEAPLMADFLSGASAEHFAAVKGRSRQPRRGLRGLAPARARPGLLHPHNVRVRGRRARHRPERGGRRRAATTGWWRNWAVLRLRASASPSASTGSCWRATQRALSPRPRHRSRCLWWTSPAARARSCCATGSGRPAWAWTGHSTAAP